MRLGAYPCKLKPGSLAYKAYNQDLIHERHRHRYEFNMRYREQLEKCGMEITGISPDETLVEIIEIQGPPLVSGVPVPPGVQVEAFQSPSAFPGFHKGRH